MKKFLRAGLTNQTLDIFVQDSSSTTGAGLTGLLFNTSGLTCYYRKGATGTPTALSLATQTVGGAHTDGGFVELDSTNTPGMYRLDLSDTIIDTAGTVTLFLHGATDMAPVTIELQIGLIGADTREFLGNAVAMGVNNIPDVNVADWNDVTLATTNPLPNAAANAAGGIPTAPAAGIFTGMSSLTEWLGLLAGKQTGNATARTEIRATGAGSGTFDETADSLEAIRDRGDVSWITGGGGGLTQSLNVQPVLPTSIDLADTASVRIGLVLVNALDDLPSTAEITPGTISIERKAIGGTSWSAIETDTAMSEQAGMVYFDEVFNSGAGYAEGDSIRVTFKSVSITADANTHEVCDSNGIIFQTEIRQTMRGTDDGALEESLEAFVQLLARSDSAIATDRAAYLSRINADEGSGAGNYDESTDSLEAAFDNIPLAPTASAIADAVWDEAMSGHTTNTEFGGFLQEQADKFLAYIQLLARSDAAIGTDRATELGEINADEGSGVGNFTQLVDSQEAIADQVVQNVVLPLVTIDSIVDAIKAVTDNLPDSGALTSLAQGDKLLAFAQLLARSDSAISTDRSAELSEMNADEGSGAGNYNPGTQSQEAIVTDTDGLSNIASEVNQTLSDTNELQTDWANGGRLDLLVDAIKAVTDNIPDSGAMNDLAAILADTDITIPNLISSLNDLDAAATGDAVLDEVVEGTWTLRQLVRLFASALAGKLSGAGTGTITIRDIDDSKNRIVASTDASGNRTAFSTLDGS